MMANILTVQEAANQLRCEVNDALMLDLLPAVDAEIEHVTGRDWAVDMIINQDAKSAARDLITCLHEGGWPTDHLKNHYIGCITRLEALASHPDITGIPLEKLKLIRTNIALRMAVDTNIMLIFNHEMATSATADVSLQDAIGNTVTTTNSLDAGKKILTINPDTGLNSNADYKVIIDYAEDIYGQTLYKEVYFSTEE